MSQEQANIEFSIADFASLLDSALQSGLISDIFLSIDKTRYLSRNQLKLEIKTLVDNLNRVNIEQIVKSTNIHYSNIEDVILEVLKENLDIMYINKNLLNPAFIKSVIEYINKSVELDNVLSLSNVAIKFNLPIEFILDLFTKNKSKINAIQDQFNDRFIFTSLYESRINANITHQIDEINNPISISQFRGLLDPLLEIPESRIIHVLENGILNGIVKGKLRNSIYTPKIYLENQQLKISNMLQLCTILEFKKLRESGLEDPISFIKLHFPLLILLEDSVLSLNQLKFYELEIIDILEMDLLIDVELFLKPILNLVNCRRFIQCLISNSDKFEHVFVIEDRFIVKSEFEDKLMKLLKPFISDRADIARKKSKKDTVVISSAEVVSFLSNISELKHINHDLVHAIASRNINIIRTQFDSILNNIFTVQPDQAINTEFKFSWTRFLSFKRGIDKISGL